MTTVVAFLKKNFYWVLIASQELHFVKIVHNVANGMQKTFSFFSLFQLIKCRDTQLTQRDLCDKYSLLPLRPYWDHVHHTRMLTELQWRCSKLTLSRCHGDLTWSILRVNLMLFAKCIPAYGEILGNPTATNVDAPVRDDATTLLRAPPGVLL